MLGVLRRQLHECGNTQERVPTEAHIPSQKQSITFHTLTVLITSLSAIKLKDQL